MNVEVQWTAAGGTAPFFVQTLHAPPNVDIGDIVDFNYATPGLDVRMQKTGPFRAEVTAISQNPDGPRGYTWLIEVNVM